MAWEILRVIEIEIEKNLKREEIDVFRIGIEIFFNM